MVIENINHYIIDDPIAGEAWLFKGDCLDNGTYTLQVGKSTRVYTSYNSYKQAVRRELERYE